MEPLKLRPPDTNCGVVSVPSRAADAVYASGPDPQVEKLKWYAMVPISLGMK